jgi:glucokinase
MDEQQAIGIDVGASWTKIVRVGAGLMVTGHAVVPSTLKSSDPEPYFRAVSAAAAELAQGLPLRGIGISLCSLIDEDHNGALLSVNAPGLNHWNIRQAFAQRFGCRVEVMNDVNAYLLAEAHLGAGRGARRLVCLALGTGLSIAAMVNGRMIEIWGGIAADAGRVILEPESVERCNGGVRGSAEALCGAAAVERLGQSRYGRTVSAREVILAAQAGDPPAVAVMSEVGARLGQLLALVSPIFFPQRIVVTGGTAEAGEALLGPIRNRYAALIGDYMANLAAVESGAPHPVEIVRGTLGPEAAALGTTIGFF